MMERSDYGLLISEANQIPSKVEQGLKALFICVHGTSRSPDAAMFFSQLQKPSLYLIGGVLDVCDLSKKNREIFFNFATESPNLIFMFEEEEQREYQGILGDIHIKKGTLIINTSLKEIRIRYLSS